jgi:glycosyltransferase domain-containing protein
MNKSGATNYIKKRDPSVDTNYEGCKKMSGKKKTTIVLHTRNRPEFVLRWMGNLDKQDKRDIEVIVADGSSSKIWSNLEKAINDNQYRHNIKLLHHDFDTSFLQRLNDAVEMVTTPYVLLAADDDLYMFD